jgi:hypothetical protein
LRWTISLSGWRFGCAGFGLLTLYINKKLNQELAGLIAQVDHQNKCFQNWRDDLAMKINTLQADYLRHLDITRAESHFPPVIHRHADGSRAYPPQGGSLVLPPPEMIPIPQEILQPQNTTRRIITGVPGNGQHGQS